MSSDDDPFGMRDSDRTQFSRPAPGGRARKAAPVVSAPTPRRFGSFATINGTAGRGPLVECAFGLLSMLPLLRSRTPPVPVDQLRAQIEGELRSFSERAQVKGLDQRMVRLGHYALCAVIDDVVLNTPWGAYSTWQSSSLAGALHNDAAAGEHLFDYLDQAKDLPQRNRPVLELITACLSLGFEGQYRIRPQGQYELQQVRGELLAILQRLDTTDDGALSGHWQGTMAAHAPIGRLVPIWVFASAAAALLIIVYSGLLLSLGQRGDRLDDRAATLLPAGAVATVQPVAAAPVAVPRPVALGPRLRACLPEATRNDPEAVVESVQGLHIRLPNNGLFTVGSADLQGSIRPTIVCLGQLLKTAGGRVLVVGHTDNLRIHTTRFPSNLELSTARANAVATMIAPTLDGNVQIAGRGDSEPIASNDTEAGRSLNRRVEILLLK